MVSIRWLALAAVAAGLAYAAQRIPMKAVDAHSARQGWLDKKVLARRLLDDKARPTAWTLAGQGKMSFAGGARKAVRVEVTLQGVRAQPSAIARLAVAGEDWRAYNRLSFWVRTELTGFPILTLMVALQNGGKQPPAQVHQREAIENVTPVAGAWTRFVWEIPHLERERVTSIEFRPWVNKRLADPWDRVAYEIGPIELERVEPDHYEGWSVAPGRIAFSHSGYLPGAPKTALATGLAAATFEVLPAAGGAPVLRKPIAVEKTRLGEFERLDFSEVRAPGAYVLRAGAVTTRPFRIGDDVWDASIAKTINFFYAERCGVSIPGVHESCHHDWRAAVGERSLAINGGWHDAGDLSQGLVNTGEATHAMFSLALAMREAGRKPAWLADLVEEARWGLEWVQRVRFPGGYRVGFASMNLWTNGVIGDEDDRVARALDNPNVNYIAAAAGAAAARFLQPVDAALARKSLAIAEDDWRHAVAGVETPDNLSTPAFAASQMELTAGGMVASLELYRATGREEFARKAVELARVVMASQQKSFVGSSFPLAGFFYTGPDRKHIFHQFHRASDQQPAVALAMLCDALPNHPEWIQWYAAAARYAEYQKRAARSTAPYGVLPAYVYRDDEWQSIAEGDRYGSSRADFREQVLAGMAMGGGYHLRAFPVWFTRRGNYGVLLSQAKATAVLARLRGDPDGAALAQTQLQWVTGRNPFCQSTMWGEGYDFAPQYSVSVGDIVGSLPVGMMTRANADRPYWPATNSYVYKEVWVHPSARWLSIFADALTPVRTTPAFTLTHSAAAGAVTLTVESTARGRRRFRLRAENLAIDGGEKMLDGPGRVAWKARVTSPGEPWVAVVNADGDAARWRDAIGY